MKFLKIIIFVLLPVSIFAWKMESGKVILPATTSASGEWQRVILQQTYETTPLIFALLDEGTGYTGDSPVALRIRNISTTEFEIVQVEAQSSTGDTEGEHPAVTLHYIAVEAGDHIMNDGTRVLADSIDTAKYQGKKAAGSKSWESINFLSAFSDTPVVLSSIQTLNNESATLPGEASSPWMTVTMRNIASDKFDMALERSETSTDTVTNSETVAYLAVDANIQTSLMDTDNCTEMEYETILTSDSVRGWDNNCNSYSFSNTYSSSPNVIGNKQSRDGGDGGWLRRCSLSNTEVGITVDEDQAADSERSHTTEKAGLVIFAHDFVYDSTKTLGCKPPVVDYHMDECYWFDNSGGVEDDVKDSGPWKLDATSYNTAKTDINTTLPPLCHFGVFNGTDSYLETPDNPLLTTTNNYTVSAWINPSTFSSQYEIIMMKTTDYTDGFTFYTYWDSNDPDTDGYIVLLTGDGNNNDYIFARIKANKWTHVVASYDGSTLRMYINGIKEPEVSTSLNILNTETPLIIGHGLNNNYYYDGSVDEVKLYDLTLSDVEAGYLFKYENKGYNYNSSARECKTCQATIAARSWELLGIPADLRTESDTSINKIFGDDFSGTYGQDWRIYTREYSESNNSSWYTYLDDINTPLDFGKAYWLGSKKGESWDVNDIKAVDYNSTNPACTVGTCVEIDLKSVSLDENREDTNGTGPYRYYMTGFTGKAPVDWADCRIIINDTVYTPSDAETEDYVSKTIWQYNSSGEDYTTCDDTTPGSCLLQPYKGFWIELHGPTKGKTVKLLIPKE